MKKTLILFSTLILSSYISLAQRIHYFNPAHVLSITELNQHEVSLGYNAGFGLVQTGHSLNSFLNLSTSFGYRKSNKESVYSEFNSRKNETLTAQIMLHGFKPIKENVATIEGQIGFGGTDSYFSDKPKHGPVSEESYAEKVKFSEVNAQFVVLVHFYKKYGELYLGFRSIQSRFSNLWIYNSMFDDNISEKETFANNNGMFIGFQKVRKKKFTLGVQLGFTSAKSRQLAEPAVLDLGFLGSYDFINRAVYSGSHGTAMIKLSYLINPKKT